MRNVRAIVIGAGPAGLACAAALQSAGCSPIVLEQASSVASSWRHHYERLHLHTHRRHSGLPGLPMPSDYPAYPSRDQVIAYLEAYAEHHRIAPHFETRVMRITRGVDWIVETDRGDFAASDVILATGFARTPVVPDVEGIESFSGRVLHSRDYVNGDAFHGRTVLVVGLGNSGGEIALDLADAGIRVALSVRGPVNIVPRDLFGLPIQTWAILQRPFPPAVVDAINAPIRRMTTGDLTRYGLRRPSKGPMTQIARDRKIPLIDIGTVGRIKAGRIIVRPGLSRIEGGAVVFADGARDSFDTIIFATGYRPDLGGLLPDHRDVLDAAGAPLLSGRPTQHKGLHFCGYAPVSSGQLREIGREAARIARCLT